MRRWNIDYSIDVEPQSCRIGIHAGTVRSRIVRVYSNYNHVLCSECTEAKGYVDACAIIEQ